MLDGKCIAHPCPLLNQHLHLLPWERRHREIQIIEFLIINSLKYSFYSYLKPSHCSTNNQTELWDGNRERSHLQSHNTGGTNPNPELWGLPGHSLEAKSLFPKPSRSSQSPALPRGHGRAKGRVTAPERGWLTTDRAGDNTGDHKTHKNCAPLPSGEASCTSRCHTRSRCSATERAEVKAECKGWIKTRDFWATSPVLPPPPPPSPHQVPAMSQHPNRLSKQVAVLLSWPNCHGKKSPFRVISNRKTTRQQTFPSHNLKTAKYHQTSFLPSKKPCPETAHNN